MMDIAKSLNKIKDEIKKSTLKREMKRLAVQYVANSRLIKNMIRQAEELKSEQRAINKQFHEIKKELEGGDILPSDDSDPASSCILNYCSTIV